MATVVTDPSSSTRLYATAGSYNPYPFLGTDSLYRSSDSGATWTRIAPAEPARPDCIAYAPPRPEAQSDGAVYLSTCTGLYKSTDAGTSWALMGGPDNAILVGDPTNSLVLYALNRAGSRSVLKTTDGGASWSLIHTNFEQNSFTQLVVDATHPTRLYALSALSGDGVNKSEDSGATWTPINSGLPATAFNSLALSGSTLFVGTEGFGVYKTVDNGATWTPANNGISTQPIAIVRAGTGSTLYATARNSDSIATAFFTSANSGASWVPTGTLNALVGDLAVSRQSDSILYAASTRGLATSSDGGSSWTFHPNNGLQNAAITELYLDAVDPDVLYAGSLGGYKSFDRGMVWSPFAGAADTPPFIPIGVSPSRSGVVYGDGGFGRIYLSTNFGRDWTLMLNLYQGVVWSSLLEKRSAPEVLFAIGTACSLAGLTRPCKPFVVRSDDGGANWRVASSGLPGPDVDVHVGTAAMDPTNSNVLYVGVDNSVYKTVDGGGLWVNASGGLLQSRVNALAVSPAHPNTIFAGLGDFQSAPALYGLYRSDDGGTTWGPRNPAFVNLAVTALAFDPTNPSNVYAGTAGGGLYRSTDGGTSFRPISSGLNDAASLSVNAIAVDPVDGRNLYIGTNGGAFALTIDRYDSFVPVIEFYRLETDHYFMASELQADVPALDSGAFAGWTRTGRTFKAYPQATGASQPVCRFYIPPQHGDSHFYSASVSECAAVLDASTNPANPAYPNYSGYVYETSSSFFVDIPANGLCPPGELPVYRLWNRRFDSNHRYTTDPAIRDAMIARGYVLEGVVMCALQ